MRRLLPVVSLLLSACPQTSGSLVEAASDCVDGCDLFERCAVNAQGRGECVITCDYDSDCAGSCCAPYAGGGAVCAPSSASCGGSGGTGGGSASGGGSGAGGGSGSSSGACAFYSSALGRAVCEPDSSASSCSGRFLGAGTTCSGFSCTSPGDASTCTVPGSGGSGGGSGGGLDCGGAWTCTYDGQASPMCQAACAYSGQQRTFTCQQVVALVGSSLASSCCTVCR
ncbi:MAG: hypothetical protein ACOZQL_24370 [Myxococcota bacterium]